MQQIFHMRGENGKDYDVPENEMEEFKQYVPNAMRVNSHFGKNGKTYDVPENETEEFKQYVPDAQPMRRYSFSDGSTRDFTVPELAKFLRSDEYRKGERYAKDREADEKAMADWQRRRDAAQAAVPSELQPRGFGSALTRNMLSAEGIRETAEDSPSAWLYGFFNDVANSFVGGIGSGSGKITEATGHLIGNNAVGNALVEEGRAGQQAIRQALPTDMAPKTGNAVVDKVADVGRGVASVTGEFLPAAIPGVGQAYAASTLSAGAVNRMNQVYDAAKGNGFSDAAASSLAFGAGAVDALQNILLMKGFKGIWNGAEKQAADAVKQSLVKKLTVDTLKTGATMGAGGMAQDVVDQNVGIDREGNVSAVLPYDIRRTAEVGIDQFLEGGAFHLVNTGVHAVKRRIIDVKWEDDARSDGAEAARRALDAPEGRALVMCNNPEAAKKILEARSQGKDVSRKMLEDLGIPVDVAPSKTDRNALADAMIGDYRAYKEWQRRLPDAEQSAALNTEIAGIGVEVEENGEMTETASLIRQGVLSKIKDAKELDDPKRRADLVYEAAKGLLGDNVGIEGQPLTPPEPPAETPKNAPVSAPPPEGTTTPPEPAEPPQPAEAPESATPEPKPETPSPVSPAEAGETPAEHSRRIIEEGRGNLAASPNAKTVKTGKKDATATIYTPTDGTGAFKVTRKTFTHGFRGPNRADNEAVSQHLGETLDGSLALPEHGTDGTRFRMSAVKIGGEDAHVLFTINKAGSVTDVDVLKGLNAKRNPEGTKLSTSETLAAGTFEVSEGSIADFDRVWQEQFKPGITKPKTVKADPKKAAKAVEGFVATDPTRKTLMHVHHDHEEGVAVATDGRVLIATKHGYDKNAKDDPEAPYPNWRQVIPDYDGKTYRTFTEEYVEGKGKWRKKAVDLPVHTLETDPAAVSAACKKAASLAKAVGHEGAVYASLELPDGGRVMMDPAYLRKVADAMGANGITEIRAVAPNRPILAKNADTTIVAMPLRGGTTDAPTGRVSGNPLVIDAMTGRILTAPERSDNTAMTSRKWADELKKEIARARDDAMADARTEDLFKNIAGAWKRGETDAKAVFDGYSGDGAWEKLPQTERTRFEEWFALKDENALAEKVAEYVADQFPDLNRWRKDLPREVAKIEKRIAAEDEIDALMAGEPPPAPAPKPVNKGKGKEAVQAAKALGSPDAASPLRPAPKGAKLVQGEFDGMGGETAARPEATALKGKSDLSKPDNVIALREYVKGVTPTPIPQRLSDGKPKTALEWFEANMVGKTFSFDIPGYGHREFTVKPGHIGTLVCRGGRNADGTRIVKGRIAKANGDIARAFEMVRNGEVSEADVEGWDPLRAKSLPLVPEVFKSFDVALHEKDAHGNDIVILAKKFVNKKGRPNVVVMKLVNDNVSIGPLSSHVGDLTFSWLKNKDLLLTDEGKVYDGAANDSASRSPLKGDNAEGNSPESGDMIPRPGGEVKGGAENSQETKKTPDPQNAARNPSALRDPAFVKWAKSKGRAPTPFARRAYDAAQLRAAVPLYRNVFPDMNIVIHDKVEDPAKWTADHPDGTQKMIGGVGGASNMGIKGAADAEALEKAGKDREEIWRKTGWWRAKDGKWRFELPSTKMKDARALYAALIEGHNETTLGKILDAPELFEAYPQLKDTKIILSPEHNDETGGWYNRIKNEIVLFDAGLVSLKDMPSHERDLRDTYQRVLDSDEFVRRRFADMDAFGIEHGTVEEEREYARWWIERQDKGIARTNETKIRDLANDRRVWSVFGKIIHEVQHAVQHIEGFATGASGNEDGYSRFAGEVEARNAARREAMSPEERAATPPWASEDVAEGTQIIRRMIVDPKSGEVLGWYTPQFKEVHLNPGATVETLAHEMLHAVQDWAKTNSPKLAKALDDIARDCPERLKKRIMRADGGVSPETIMKEWGAFNFMGGPEGGRGRGGAALRDELAKRENAAWLGRFWDAAKDAWKDMAAKMGGNRIDLDAIDSKTPQEAMDFLARAFAEGGTVGKANPPGKSVRPAIDMTKPLSFAEKWDVNLHDYRSPLKWLRDEMAKRGSSFADDTDFYEAARLQKGYDQAAVNDANRRLKEYTGKLKKLGVKHEEVVEFMQAQAAKDRNAMILEKFGRENGSGMTDAEAARTIKAFEDAGKGDALREISDFLLDMQREGLQYRVETGLLSAEDAQRMADREPFHVPFRSAVDPETGDYVQWGSDKALEKAEFKEAKGRKTLADDVVGWMFSEFIDAHTRGNENRIRKMVADAMRLNAKSGVGKILKGARKQSAYDFSAGEYKTGADGDGRTGDKAKTAIVDDPRFRESRKNGDGGRKNVLAFKEGGRTHYIEFAEGERGERLQAAVNGRDLKSMGKLWKRGMRFWSSTATEWAPTFALRNFAADNIDVFGNYIGEHGIVKGSASYARHLKNAAALTPAITRYIATGDIPQGVGGEWIRRYEQSGGLIAGYASEGYGEITAKIDAEIAKSGRSKGAAIINAVKTAITSPLKSVRKVLGKVWYPIDVLNRYAELLTRVSAFRTQCENGMTDHKAALWSRESTVDFNEKGNFTGITNGLWMFSNSTLGASARQLKSIFKSKYGWQTVAAFVGYGLAEGLLEALMNGDDEEREAKGEGAGKDVSEYTRANSLYVRRGGRVYRVPFHAGPFSYIKYAGNCAARVMLGKMKPEDAAKELGWEALSQLFHYTGVGDVNMQSQSGRFADDAATFAGTAAPSLAQPLVQGAFNIDHAGRSIYNEGFPGDRTPRSAQGRRSTPGWAKDAAAWLNEATRSEGHETGYIDLPPEIIKMAGEAVGKNLLRDVMNAGTVCAMAFGDEKYDVRNVPVARDFVRAVDGNDRRYNDARKEYEANADYLKKHAREMSAEERRAYVEKFPHAAFVAKGRQRLDGLETEIRRLRKMEDGFAFVKGKAVPREWPEERLEAFRKRRRELQALFLKEMGM